MIHKRSGAYYIMAKTSNAGVFLFELNFHSGCIYPDRGIGDFGVVYARSQYFFIGTLFAICSLFVGIVMRTAGEQISNSPPGIRESGQS